MLKICRGDLFESDSFKLGPYILMHGCNDIGRYGAGFAMEVRRRFPDAYQHYLMWFGRRQTDRVQRLRLGAIQLVPVGDGESYICNAITQHGVASYRSLMRGQTPPFRLDAFESCLSSLTDLAPKLAEKSTRPDHFTILMPQIGCGLGGFKWSQIEPSVLRAAEKCPVPIVVYVH